MLRKIAIVLLLVAVITVLALPFFLRIDRFRPAIEKRCSEILAVPIHLEGPLSFGLLPSPHFAVEKISVDNQPGFGPASLLTARRLAVRVAFLSLLKKRLEVIDLRIEGLHIDFVKNRQGRINIPPLAEGAALSPFSVKRVDISGLELSYQNEKSGYAARLRQGNLQLEDIVLGSAESFGKLLAKHLDLQGRLSIGHFSDDNREIADLSLRFALHGGKSEIEGAHAGMSGCLMEGKAHLDLGVRPVLINVEAGLLPGDGRKGECPLQQKGSLTLQTELNVNPKAWPEFLASLKGKVKVEGKGLLVPGYDLDAVIDQYRTTSNIDLIDIGTFLVAGPLAVLVEKGVDVAWLQRGVADVRTRIVLLGAAVDLTDGQATALDVAFTTERNRIAVKGQIDLVQKRYRQVKVAVVDAKGCPEVMQTIDGPLDDPDFNTAELGLQTLSKPLTSIFKKATNLIGTEVCQPFYEGTISPPR